MAQDQERLSRRIYSGLNELRRIRGNPSVQSLGREMGWNSSTASRILNAPEAKDHTGNPRISSFLRLVATLGGGPKDIDDMLDGKLPMAQMRRNIETRAMGGNDDKADQPVLSANKITDPEIRSTYLETVRLSDYDKLLITAGLNAIITTAKKVSGE